MSGVISQAIMSGPRFKLPHSMEKGGGMVTSRGSTPARPDLANSATEPWLLFFARIWLELPRAPLCLDQWIENKFRVFLA